ncbi:MAG TPA: penicillin-binding protein, partial [Bacteroidia bacterium]
MAKKSSKKIIWLLAFSPLLALLLGLTLAGLGVFGTLPNFDQLENPSYSRATIIYSADGKVLGKYYIQNRTTVDYDEISPKLIDALVSTEDAR